MQAPSAPVLSPPAPPAEARSFRPEPVDALAAERPAYVPIGAYGLIGDGRACALVDTDGSLDWLCWPDFDSPALFCAILDRRRGGRFRIGPSSRALRTSRRYVPETAVLETTFETQDGVLRLTDFMPVRDEERLAPLREIVRLVEAIEGDPEMGFVYAPRPDWATRPPRLAHRPPLGIHCEASSGAVHFLTDSSWQLDGEAGTVRGRERLAAGERRAFSLTFSADEPAIATPLDAVCEALEETLAFWRGWSGRCTYRGEYRDAVLRSAITLKLLTYAPSGALLAAATTSLPEVVGGDLNWDYRHCWLRDASLCLHAFGDLGFSEEAARFIDWLLHTTRLSAPELKPVYSILGRLDLPERRLDHLEGYRGSHPVRIGNAARGQVQLDVYGTVVHAAHDHVVRGGVLDPEARGYLEGFAEVVRRRWREPDAGIWEIRGSPRRHTHSAIMCWTALDRLIALHDRGVVAIDCVAAAATREEIRRDVETAFDPELGAYSGIIDGRALDAAVLAMDRTDFHPPDHPRLVATRARLREALGAGPLLHRFDARFDEPAGQEASFGICAFWEIQSIARCGDVAAAKAQFEALLSLSNDLGLFAEEIEEGTGAALGNFPQAFSHAGLVVAALSIERARGEGAGGRRDDSGEVARCARS